MSRATKCVMAVLAWPILSALALFGSVWLVKRAEDELPAGGVSPP